jgi:hypothetical protein
VAEDVAMKDEIPNVRPPEIHAECDAGEGMIRVLVPEGDLYRIKILAIGDNFLLGAIKFEVVL